MSDGQVPYGSSAWWVRQVTSDLAIELWPGDGAHVQLVATSYPVKVALGNLEALRGVLAGAIEALDQAAGQELNAMGPVAKGER